MKCDYYPPGPTEPFEYTSKVMLHEVLQPLHYLLDMYSFGGANLDLLVLFPVPVDLGCYRLSGG